MRIIHYCVIYYNCSPLPPSPGGTWHPGPWSACHVDSSSPPRRDNGQCQGTQYRNVSCLTQLNSDVPPLPCGGLQPAHEAPCTVDCPQNCVVGPWGRWTPCKQCGKLQSRNRAVVVAPSHGGQQCPRLTEVRICEDLCDLSSSSTTLPTTTSTTTTEPSIPWLVVGEWSECAPVEQIDMTPSTNNQKDPFNFYVNDEEREDIDNEKDEIETSGDGNGKEYSKKTSEVQVTRTPPPSTRGNIGDKSSANDAPLTVKGSEPLNESTLPEYDDLFLESPVPVVAEVGTQTRTLSCQSATERELPLRLVQT